MRGHDDVHVGHRKTGRGDPPQHPLRRDQRRRGEDRELPVRPQRHRALDPQVQGDLGSPLACSGADAVHVLRAGRRRGRPRQRQIPPPDDDPPADRGAGWVLPVEDGDPRPGRRGIGHRPGGDPCGEGRRDAGRGRRHAGARHVVGQLVEPDPHPALVLLDDDQGACARALHHPSRSPGVASAGSSASATSRRSATPMRVGRSRCISPAEPPNRVSVTRRSGRRATPGRRRAGPASRARWPARQR